MLGSAAGQRKQHQAPTPVGGGGRAGTEAQRCPCQVGRVWVCLGASVLDPLSGALGVVAPGWGRVPRALGPGCHLLKPLPRHALGLALCSWSTN